MTHDTDPDTGELLYQYGDAVTIRGWGEIPGARGRVVGSGFISGAHRRPSYSRGLVPVVLVELDVPLRERPGNVSVIACTFDSVELTG